MITERLFGDRGKRRITALALAATVTATVFLLWQSDEPVSSRNVASELRGGPAEPDGFVIGGQYRAWDEQGNLQIDLKSPPRIEQFEATGTAHLDTPRARLFSEGSPEPWLIESNEGSLQQNNEMLELMGGNVRLTRQSKGREAILETGGALTLDNSNGTVYTDQPVTITDLSASPAPPA